MIRDDAIILHIYPVRTEITGTKYIMILHVCSMYKKES